MKKIYLITALVFVITLICCNDQTIDSINIPTRELTANEKVLVQSAGNFSFNIFSKIVNSEPGKNILVSPLSISMALGMTINGADGTTYDAMKNTLGLSSFTQVEANESFQSLILLLTSIDSKVTMSIANSIWYSNQYNFKTDFIETNKKYFNAVVSPLNFNDIASVSIINNWVKNATKDKIDKIIDQIPPETIMYLINAVYLKGSWKIKFDPNKTRDDFFTTSSGKQVPIKMMEQELNLPVLLNSTFTMADLPYGNGDYSMTLLLPNSGKTISEVATYLTTENFNSAVKQLVIDKKRIFLPKFMMEYKLKLNDVLKAMGMDIAFDPFKANFKKLYEGIGNAYISSVDHKTYIDVNEEGTEAAAVTNVSVGVTSMPNNIIRFDRPFIFIIREKNSGAIIFIGTLCDPK